MEQQLDIGRFISLKKQEIGAEDSDAIAKLAVCTQSIYRWLQYCEYHYVNLVETATGSNLRFDRISVYRRAGETVPIRYVYEANIAAFLNNFHALNGGINFQPEIVTGENVVSFIEECHDALIPKLFNLCESVVRFKSSEISNDL